MNAAIVIPVYNHAQTIASVIAQVRAAIAGIEQIGEVVVVNDGCCDGTSGILSGIPGITILKHQRNRGKGAALWTAFEYARRRGFTHAITVDADGQHDPADIAAILGAARTHPEDLIIGYRDMDSGRTKGAIPGSSRRGRDISRFWLRVQTGQDIPDSQCGLRAYPLELVLALTCRFRRFDFETEVLARLAWGGVRVRSIPVKCIYFAKGRRVSHFRPVIDTLRGIRVNVFLVARRLLPLRFTRLVRDSARNAGHAFGRWWRPAAWREALREALAAGNSNPELATALAVGVFVGLTPFYLLQTVLAIYLARRLHLNILAAVIGSQISIPPLAPLWIAMSYGVGNFLVHGQWFNAGSRVFAWRTLPAFLLGNLAVATVMAALALLVARQLLAHLRPRRGLAAPQLAPSMGTTRS